MERKTHVRIARPVDCWGQRLCYVNGLSVAQVTKQSKSAGWRVDYASGSRFHDRARTLAGLRRKIARHLG